MDNFEATFTDISDWEQIVHYSTGGTRSKYITVHPITNEEYFFKGSKETPNGEIRYPTEFWSEIVSSKIGQSLGFKMLDYNIAYDKKHRQRIGCLSKSMILHSENKLTEGVYYLTGFNSKYDPDKDKNKYTFQFIKKALSHFDLQQYINNIIEVIIFDSIISNSDRHQENWGVIMYYKQTIAVIENQLSTKKLGFWGNIDLKFKRYMNKAFIVLNKQEKKMSTNTLKFHSEATLHQFAPIYDSGCCLGREHEESKVEKMINDNQMLETYIKKGDSEIHWDTFGKKCNHFDLVSLLLEQHPEETKFYIGRTKQRYSKEKIQEIIENIDTNLPEELKEFKLTASRKKLMFKLITLRTEKLLDLL
jgi:hypothetical protein